MSASLALLLAALPALYWEQPPGSAEALRAAGIRELRVPPEHVAGWRQAGFAATALTEGERRARTVLEPPGLAARATHAGATQRPWIDANGWRFLRRPRAKYFEAVPAGAAELSALEGFAYDADLVLRIAETDLAALGRTLAFLRGLPDAPGAGIADLGVVDDGSALTGELMNLLARRNLLFRPLEREEPALPVSVALGSREYPASEAADPDALAFRVRQRLGDERRSLRLFGSEVVLARLTGDASRRRLQLLNYGGRRISGLRVRLRGRWTPGTAQLLDHGPVALEALLGEADATEFSLPLLGPYAVVDLSATP